MISNERKKVIKDKAYYACGKVSEFISMLCRNSIVVSNDRELFRLPLIVFVIAILGAGIVLPAVIISLFCGVEYTFSGEDFVSSPKLSFR